MQTDPPAGVSASPVADNVMTWYENTLKNILEEVCLKKTHTSLGMRLSLAPPIHPLRMEPFAW